jgi:hypothetical protein
MSTIRAWHFVGKTLRDGTHIPRDGEKLIYKGKPILCARGLHASVDAFDALQYAPGDTLCLVECGGEITTSNDKLVCTERTIIARIDANDMLRYFARMQALSVIHLYPNGTDDIVFDYLMTGNESLRDAARATAWDAARATTLDAALDAAWATAWDAARATALDAALDAAREEFNNLVKECFGIK